MCAEIIELVREKAKSLSQSASSSSHRAGVSKIKASSSASGSLNQISTNLCHNIKDRSNGESNSDETSNEKVVGSPKLTNVQKTQQMFFNSKKNKVNVFSLGGCQLRF
jgi:hypothetical protein